MYYIFLGWDELNQKIVNVYCDLYCRDEIKDIYGTSLIELNTHVFL